MRTVNFIKFCIFTTLFLLTACAQPLSQEVRDKLDAETTFAMISDNPTAFLDRHILLGGAVISTDEDESTTTLEVLEWRLSSRGKPLYVDDHGRRFLVRAPKGLGPSIYEPGTLVTLAGVLQGQETIERLGTEYTYPLFSLTEIHVWESPFRYGIHRNLDPGQPIYVGKDDDPRRHPYDPGFTTYPYAPYWFRTTTHE